MQKVLRINLLARNNQLKRARKQLFKDRKDEEKDFERHASRRTKVLREERRAERKERREDWINGELAANRNAGLKKGVYGTTDAALVTSKEIPTFMVGGPKETEDFGLRKNWAGEGNEGNIVVGDRVCVIRGVEEAVGKIGTVKDVDPSRGELTVMEVNMADVQIPPYMHPSQRTKKLNSLELPLKFADVRLVVSIADPETGTQKDTVVRHLRGGAPHYEREYGSNIPRHTRYIAGEDIEIAWPEAEIQEREAQPYDTTRRDVEDETYVPSIFKNPLGVGVENELIKPYDRLRRRHGNGWMQRKIVEDARSAWYEQRKLMVPTPFNLMRAAHTSDQNMRIKRQRARIQLPNIIEQEQARVEQMSAG